MESINHKEYIKNAKFCEEFSLHYDSLSSPDFITKFQTEEKKRNSFETRHS